MSEIKLTLTEIETTILTAHAKIRGTTVEALISAQGVRNVINEALNEETNLQVTAGTLSSDIKDEVVKDFWIVQQKVTNMYNNGNVPESILTGLVARAAKVK